MFVLNEEIMLNYGLGGFNRIKSLFPGLSFKIVVSLLIMYTYEILKKLWWGVIITTKIKNKTKPNNDKC